MKNRFVQALQRGWNRVRGMVNRVYSAVLVTGPGGELFSRYNKLRLIREAYERNPYINATTNLKARGVAGLPFIVKVNGEIVPDHPVLDVFANLEEGLSFLIERYVMYHEVTGDAYMQLVTNEHEGESGNYTISKPPSRGAKLMELVVWPSQNMNPVQGTVTRPIQGYRYRDVSGTVDLAKWEVAHWRTVSLTEHWHGLPPVTPLAEIVEMSNSYIRWNMVTAKNEGRPALIGVVEGHMPTDEQVEQIQENWAQYSGPENRGKLPVIGGLKLESPDTTPAEANWLEGDKHAGRLIAMGESTPSELINDAQNKTYNNHREAEKAFYLRTLIPLANQMWQIITRALQIFYPGLSIEVDVDSIDALSETQEEKEKRVANLYREGLISRNEARRELRFEDHPEDIIITPSGNTININANGSSGRNGSARPSKSYKSWKPTDERFLPRRN